VLPIDPRAPARRVPVLWITSSLLSKIAEWRGRRAKHLFQRMLKDEEEHADFLDAQLHSIKEMAVDPG